jgi:Lar family restriction alleviation protein
MREASIMNKLKPCPFCGGDDTDASFSRGWKGGDRSKPTIAAGCYGCGAVGPDVLVNSGSGYAESTEAWNKRHE